MNLTINELERSLYIQGRLTERRALLEFESAFDDAIDNCAPEDEEEDPGLRHFKAQDIASAGHKSTITNAQTLEGL